MATKKKLLQAAAGNAGGGAALNVEDVFSTYLNVGSSDQTIINGINLGDNLTGPYTEIAKPIVANSGVGGYLYRNSDFSGNADGKTFTFSGWGYPTGSSLRVLQSQPNQDSGVRFSVMFSNALFKVQGYNSGGTKIIDTGWRTLALNSWYHFLISVDLSSTSNRYLYINDVEELGPSSSWTTYTNDSIDFTNSHHYVNAYRSSADNGVQAGGGLAQIYLDYTYRDLSVVNNRRTFVTANIAPAGNLSSLNPILYLPFDATNSTGSNLGTGGDFVAYNTSYFEAKETGGPGYDAGSGEGGLVWGKSRNVVDGAFLVDSARGKGSNNNFKYLRSDTASQELDIANRSLSSMNSNGFTFQGADNQFNGSGNEYVYWTFRKAPKFFDVVTWTGDGTNNRKIPHNLGSEVGCYFVKQANDSRGWSAYHRGVNGGTNPEQYVMVPSDTDAQNNVSYWNDTAPTSTEFTINSSTPINESGGTYVAYLWAHNDGDGEFGPDGDKDIIKCGSYTGTGATGNNVNLGFEPQWLMIKRTDSTGNWQIADVMRGMPNNGGAGAYQRLSANLSDAEVNGQEGPIPTSTGFVLNSTSTDTNGNGNTYIYIAIRRPTAVPESATEVFAIDQENTSAPYYTSGFPIDMAFFRRKDNASDWYLGSRLIQGKELVLNTTSAEGGATNSQFDYMDGWSAGAFAADVYSWMWKRASGYMDVVAYTGNSTAGRTVAHNLGVVPEMMWVKQRPYSSDWRVYHKDIGAANGLRINNTSGTLSATSAWNSTAPTSSVFTLGTSNDVNENPLAHIAYLFASLDGISKVGSVTHSGTTNVDCGFSSGARFVLLKRTDAVGGWYVWDSVRGIVSGNDPYLLLNSTDAEVTNTDYIDPLSSGFTITSSFTAGDYIFYAIA